MSDPATPDLATTVAAWTGAIGVALTWTARLVSSLLKRRTRLGVQLLDGPSLGLANKSETTVDIRPPDWGGNWIWFGKQEGVKYVHDSKGNYIRLASEAEFTLSLLPDRSKMGGSTLEPETVSRLLKENRHDMYVYRRDGKKLARIAFRDIEERLLVCLDTKPKH